MLTKRIIPCLDIRNGRTVKGKNFNELRDAGDPVELAKKYYEEDADELVLLDISATADRKNTDVEIAKKVAEEVFIPFTIGGGIRSLEQIEKLLKVGADKVAINSAALANPKIIRDAAAEFGSQAVVVSIDVLDGMVYSVGGSRRTGWKAVEWAKRAAELGAGEILLTSINRDGTGKGFEIGLTRRIVESVRVPVIASGGAGSMKDFAEVFLKAEVSGALGAGAFHYGKLEIGRLKKYLKRKGVEVREYR